MDRLALARQWVHEFDAKTPRSLESRTRTLHLLNESEAPFDRNTYEPGHITGSALVLSPNRRRFLLIHHRRLGLWLQPGGHVDPGDADVVATARREVIEETSVSLGAERPVLIGVDVHEIPAARGEPAHLHHDLMFRFVAASEAIVASAETGGAIWCPVEESDRYELDEPVVEGLARALA